MTDAVRAIQETVAAYYGITAEKLLSKRRTRDIVRPRQIAMHLCVALSNRSLPDLGRRFGNMDHTTVMHACKRIAKLAADSDIVRSDLKVLEHACAKLNAVHAARRLKQILAERAREEAALRACEEAKWDVEAMECVALKAHGFTLEEIVQLQRFNDAGVVNRRLARAEKLERMKYKESADAQAA